MPRVKQAKCPNCNAALPVNIVAPSVRCSYCGNDVIVEHPPPQIIPAGNRPNVLAMFLPTASIVVLAVVAVIIVKLTSRSASRSARRAQVTRVTVTSSTPAPVRSARPTEQINWHEHYGVRTAKVNSDGVDDMLALATVTRSGKSTLHLIAIDGDSGGEIWRSDSLGDISIDHPFGKVHFAVRRSRLVITDRKRNARIHELSTLKLERSASLSDVANWICTELPDPDKVWIEAKDKNHVVLDLATAATAAAKRPPRCLPWHVRVDCQGLGGNSRCIADRRSFPKAPGYSPGFATAAQETMVGLGYKFPGTRRPMVAGYARKGKRLELTWKRYVVEDPDASTTEGTPPYSSLAGGRLVVAYQHGKSEKMQAIDAASGKPLWVIDLPATSLATHVEAIAASPTRIFAIRDGVLVLDPSTGAILRRIPKQRSL